MKALRVVLALVMLAVGVSAIHPASTQAKSEEKLPTSCAGFNDSQWDGYGWGGRMGEGSLDAGDTITIAAEYGEMAVSVKAPGLARQAAYFITLSINGTVVASTRFPGTLTYTVPADIAVSETEWWVDGLEALIDWNVSCGAGSAAGCDTQIELLADSVVGAFVADSPAYWTPGQLTSPLVTIPAGKTAWVLGVDASGQYYKIVWVCQYLWVKVDTMGPNYDKVWNGAPLPTGVVD